MFAKISGKIDSLLPPRPLDNLDLDHDEVAVERLNRLRLQIEGMAQSLNDNHFQVTFEWVLEFAQRHERYVHLGSIDDDVRSVTDIFQHVMRHPRVLATLEPSSSTIEDTPNKEANASAESLEPPYSAAVNEDLRTSFEQLRKVFDSVGAKAEPTASACDSTQKIEAGPPVDKPMSTCEQDPCAATREPLDQHVSIPARRWRSSSSSAAGSWQQNAERQLAAKSKKPERASSSSAVKAGSVVEAVTGSRDAAFDGLGLAVPRLKSASRAGSHTRSTGDNKQDQSAQELAQRLQRRSSGSWEGSSPRSKRLAEAQAGGDKGLDDAGLTLAAKRKLLEGKLQFCGFQKGGA